MNTAQSEIILIVETKALLRNEVAEYLRGCGYHVVEAINAAEAMSVLNDRIIDILVTDLDLQDASGFELSASAKKIQPTIKVVLTRSAERTATAAHELCEDGPLGHPYHPQQLLDRIKRLRKS